MELVYHGWSCFTVVTARDRLVFDPNWTNPFGRPHTGPASFAHAELLSRNPRPLRSHPGRIRRQVAAAAAILRPRRLVPFTHTRITSTSSGFVRTRPPI